MAFFKLKWAWLYISLTGVSTEHEKCKLLSEWGIAGDGWGMADLNWPLHTLYKSLNCVHLQQNQSNLAMICMTFLSLTISWTFKYDPGRWKQHEQYFSAWHYHSNYFKGKENPSQFATACCLAGTQLLFKGSASAGCSRTHLYSRQSGVEAGGPQVQD